MLQEIGELKNDPFPGDRIHALFIAIHVPVQTVPHLADVIVLSSSQVILEQWSGHRRSSQAPDWCLSLNLGDSYRFAYSRRDALRLVLSAADKTENQSRVRIIYLELFDSRLLSYRASPSLSASGYMIYHLQSVRCMRHAREFVHYALSQDAQSIPHHGHMILQTVRNSDW